MIFILDERGMTVSQNLQTEKRNQRLLRLPQVLDMFPVSKSTWWQGVKEGRYPQSVKLGPKTTAWLEIEILELIDLLAVAR